MRRKNIIIVVLLLLVVIVASLLLFCSSLKDYFGFGNYDLGYSVNIDTPDMVVRFVPGESNSYVLKPGKNSAVPYGYEILVFSGSTDTDYRKLSYVGSFDGLLGSFQYYPLGESNVAVVCSKKDSRHNLNQFTMVSVESATMSACGGQTFKPQLSNDVPFVSFCQADRLGYYQYNYGADSYSLFATGLQGELDTLEGGLYPKMSVLHCVK